MKNLTRHRLVLGVLMAFVLTFGVQGVTEALTLTRVSDRVQSKRPGEKFEITFRAALKSPARAYNTATPRRLVNSGVADSPEGTNTIDAQGYVVTYATSGVAYRNTGTASTALTVNGNVVTTLAVDPRPPYNYMSLADQIAQTATRQTLKGTVVFASNVLVNTNRQVYDDSGKLVYSRTGTGAYAVHEHTDGNANNDDDGDGIPNEQISPADPFVYTLVDRVNPSDPLDPANQYDYNNEKVTVTPTFGGGGTITLVNTSDNQNVLTNAATGTTGDMLETASFAQLQPQVTLSCRIQTAGTYTITITDSTVASDFPEDTAPPTRSVITFDLYVADDLTDDPTHVVAAKGTARVDADGSNEAVSSRFGVYAVPYTRSSPVVTGGNRNIRYRVISGSGTLYVGERDREDTTPKQDLTVHETAKVFLKMNGTTNEVSAAIAGNFPQTIPAVIIFQLTGTGARDPDPPRDPDPVIPPSTNPSLTLSQSTLSGAVNTSVPIIATVQDASQNPVQGVQVTFSVNGTPVALPTTNALGQAAASIILPSGGGTLTASSGFGSASATITITGAPPTEDTEEEETVGEPASIEIYDGDDQDGEINRRLPEDMVVEVLDSNNRGVSFEIVNLRVVEGSGRFSPTRPRTDRDGRASFSFTPRSPGAGGIIEIEASVGDLSPATFTVNLGEPPAAIKKVSGDNQSGRPGQALANPFIVEVVDEDDEPVEGAAVTFAVTAGGGSVSTTSTTTNNNGRAQTVLTLGEEIGENTVVATVSGLTDRITFTARTGAEVLVGAAQRPPMYWVSRTEGKLHRLVDAEVENLAPNIDNILSLTVDTQNQLLYWTRQTAESKSAIQRAGLNGRGVITLQTSLTLMTSIAVDSTGTTLYWADILGKIKSRPVQGNRVTLLAQNLSSPTGLVWANEYLYWGEATGQIRRMNLRNNRRTIETITTSSGEPVSLAVRSGRVYWTEISGNAAQLNRVNTNGTGVEALKTLTGSRRVWIDVDGSDSKIYLTRASKLERRNLSGQSTVTLVTGLESPGSLVLGGELPTSPPVVSQPTQPTQPTQPPVASKYDVNQDGSVNNADTRAVAGAVGQSGAAITNPRTDVDGSGTVDVTDLILVIANLDDDVAAPAIDVDVKALDIDFDRVQEQVETLLASGDRSIAAQRALLYLQHLLASARPDETMLLANYPNPFNPETWIPYHLAASTDVRVNIYDAQGTLVRELTLGHQMAGYYTSRSRAAYWDGRNALGERVASGIYFYQLQTDAVSPMRKMVILK